MSLNNRKLDLGCSFHKREGFVGIDILRANGIDIQADACFLPFKDNAFDEVYSSYALEHIQDNLKVIQELWRVCEHGAIVRLVLPHFSNPAFYDDLTHRHKYSTRTFEHYDHDFHKITGHPNYLPEVNLKVEKAKLGWWPPQVIDRKILWKRSVLKILNRAINFLANRYPFLCERVWCNWVGGFYEVNFTVRVIKLR